MIHVDSDRPGPKLTARTGVDTCNASISEMATLPQVWNHAASLCCQAVLNACSCVQCVFQGFFLFGGSVRIKDFSSSRYHGRFSYRDSRRENLFVSFQNGGPVQRSPIGTLQTWGKCRSHDRTPTREKLDGGRACCLLGRGLLLQPRSNYRRGQIQHRNSCQIVRSRSAFQQAGCVFPSSRNCKDTFVSFLRHDKTATCDLCRHLRQTGRVTHFVVIPGCHG